jgi:hypothetical protein
VREVANKSPKIRIAIGSPGASCYTIATASIVQCLPSWPGSAAPHRGSLAYLARELAIGFDRTLNRRVIAMVVK